MVVPCISQALEKEEKEQKEGEKLLEMDERKRSYPFSLVLITSQSILMFLHNLSTVYNIQKPHRTLSCIKKNEAIAKCFRANKARTAMFLNSFKNGPSY